ncbi:hypothetical protein JKM78_004011 [Citrobacter freundii]|uniref:hypothetical protein n=1 Tax=Citrobacter freundii TaxID=546 RepID=UPI000F9C86DD|nr:hypothetical protein [Citrobacter freundii]EBB3994477.1 hypothetical protein [Salmonella enterica]EBI0350895.1 hypothetical protein [Salmonella enterica subsp. arizonae serovar 48:z4,z23,z32:-]EDY1998334.1 hypothetical protein [Salmonella enterica subsp. diarizonae]EBM5795944.1 hypothetical protein [Salmonella enterica]EBS9963187.1 hypothetical protein [Salmonella enterica]
MTSDTDRIAQEIQQRIREQTSQPHDEFTQKEYRRLQSVTPQLFARFLTEKGVPGCCLACGRTDLSTPETTSVDISKSPFGKVKFNELSEAEREEYITATQVNYVTPIKIEPDKIASVSNHQYRLVCQNCGFTSYFRAANVVYWIEDLTAEQKDKS